MRPLQSEEVLLRPAVVEAVVQPAQAACSVLLLLLLPPQEEARTVGFSIGRMTVWTPGLAWWLEGVT